MSRSTCSVNFIILFSFLGVYTMNNSVQDLFLMVGSA